MSDIANTTLSTLTEYERKIIHEAAFRSPAPILDIDTEDEELEWRLQEYEAAREELNEKATEITDYLGLEEAGT
jgi:hypothetical protein